MGSSNLSEQFVDPTQLFVGQNGGSRDMNRERSGAWWSQLENGLNPETFINSMNGFLGQAGNYGNSLERTAAAYDPNQAYAFMQAQNPLIQQNALDFSKRAYGLYDGAYQAQANAASREGVDSVASQLAGFGMLNSGAGAAAAAEAAARPQLEYLTALTKSQGDLAGSIYGNQWGQTYDTQNGNYLADTQNRMAAYSDLIKMAQNAAAQQGQMAGVFGGLKGQEGQSAFVAPTYTENPNYMSTQDWLQLGVSGLGAAASIFSGGMPWLTKAATQGAGALFDGVNPNWNYLMKPPEYRNQFAQGAAAGPLNFQNPESYYQRYGGAAYGGPY